MAELLLHVLNRIAVGAVQQVEGRERMAERSSPQLFQQVSELLDLNTACRPRTAQQRLAPRGVIVGIHHGELDSHVEIPGVGRCAPCILACIGARHGDQIA